MPKTKITRQDIVCAATELVRTGGEGALNARALASSLGCSTQPVFFNFETMEDLKKAVRERAMERYLSETEKEIASGKYPRYKAEGMAYIRFAREEKQLFRLLYLCDRAKDEQQAIDPMTETIITEISRSIGICAEDAKLFHVEMWTFVHGIAAMLVTGYLDLTEEQISRMMTDVYTGLRKKYEEEKL